MKSLRSFLRSRWLRILMGLVATVGVILLTAAWYFRLWSVRAVQLYRGILAEGHPVYWDLVFGRVYLDQSLEDAIELTNPKQVFHHGRFTDLYYQPPMIFTGTTITAQGGRIRYAITGSCCWDRVFFDGLTKEDRDELQRELQRRFPIPPPENNPPLEVNDQEP